MDRLDAMQMFVRVVETGSFTRVAHEFTTTQPTVTKQIAAMEARLKVRLLNRNTRGVSLTEPGTLYYEKCKAIVNDVADAESVVKVRQSQVHGQLRVGSSVAFGRRVVVPLALEFMQQNPQVQIDLSFEDRYTDLVASGIDVALRLGKLADSSLGARTLGVNPWVLVASPTYLKKHGTPRRPSDLKEHATLIYSSVQGNDLWRLRNASGEAVSVPVTGRLRSNNLSALLAAARSHMGIAALPWYVAHESLKAARVVEVLKTCRLPEQEIHAVYPSPRLVPQKVQAFIAFLQGRFGKEWWEQLPREGSSKK
ncbi:LysR family transcriptional regulator [Alicycliphilus denitrificans]|uniref:Transcriptional regulator, LysR family n=2 Tax=Alicycliphilus denitrificans TaxID=179636 RepID=F4GDT6_ALIDK|nr:LysR family transcriptional regulator [Alicycliphilus denitrificans]ADV00820.1 LysR substrate-binding protein [Alicycliphilus denitrificans BC]AEB83753.1 transcriptional regulator, LysR family [Alicycliphilus denitrificans K601]QKD44981.1 LysR family transcriptional regulator [Alicycliphilus denitrificans]GAO24399.1 LysR family transcriptional regulator [Alicycliphilus sp. B1]